MSMKDLAARLNITNGALTGHIKKLESCGLITTSAESVVHGNQKICSVHWDRIIIDLTLCKFLAYIEHLFHNSRLVIFR